jgi:hypothetical protein
MGGMNLGGRETEVCDYPVEQHCARISVHPDNGD